METKGNEVRLVKDDTELCNVVYGVLKTHIQFGVYHYGDALPTMEHAAGSFFVSLDTIRRAYLRLQKDGYITISQNVGSVVIKDYSEQQIEDHVQLFFSQRKNALIDLSKSIGPLTGHAQWLGLKNAPAKMLNSTPLSDANHTYPPTFAFDYIMTAYASLGNDLLLRLLWQIFTFFEAPFFSTPKNPWHMSVVTEYAPRSLEFCLKKDWDSLRGSIRSAQDSISLSLCRFYEERITMPGPSQEIPFTWSPYKKASQICYSLAMDLLTSISRGQYPADTFLPSLSQLSKERTVSVSTVRRALSLLNGVGATKSFKRIGTKVLSYKETAKNCDFTKPVVQKRMLDMAQSLQILALSCRDVSEITISSLDTDAIQDCLKRLSGLKERQQYELITYATLDMLRQYSPYEAVRTVYTELLQQLFWGYTLYSIWKKSDDKKDLYISCFETFSRSLKEADAVRFSEKLEELLMHEFHFTISNLVRSGIKEAEELLIPAH